MSHTLINFNIPNYLKHDFDELAKFKRVSRTSILNRLIELYCRNEFRELEETSRFNQVKWSHLFGQFCGLSKMHLVFIHAAVRISAWPKYTISGVRLSRAVSGRVIVKSGV